MEKRCPCRYCIYNPNCITKISCSENSYQNFMTIKTKGERIICAAVYFKSSKKYEHQPKNIESGFVLAGWRHFNILPIAKLLNRKMIGPDHTQGFLTSKGRFVNRQEGRVIAYNAKQTKSLISNGKIKDLFSEDIY